MRAILIDLDLFLHLKALHYNALDKTEAIHIHRYHQIILFSIRFFHLKL